MTMIDQEQPADDAEADEGLGRESHREKTVRMRAIAALARTLIAMNGAQLRTIPLEPELAEAVIACQGYRKGARARQLRRIGQLLRQAELDPIERAVAEVASGRGERSRREQGYEHWRTRLLEGGAPAMTVFVSEHPGADVQALRQHVRNAIRDPEGVRGKGAARELLRAIRGLGEAVRVAKAEAAAEAGDEAEDDVESDDVESDDAESDDESDVDVDEGESEDDD